MNNKLVRNPVHNMGSETGLTDNESDYNLPSNNPLGMSPSVSDD